MRIISAVPVAFPAMRERSACTAVAAASSGTSSCMLLGRPAAMEWVRASVSSVSVRHCRRMVPSIWRVAELAVIAPDWFDVGRADSSCAIRPHSRAFISVPPDTSCCCWRCILWRSVS